MPALLDMPLQRLGGFIGQPAEEKLPELSGIRACGWNRHAEPPVDRAASGPTPMTPIR